MTYALGIDLGTTYTAAAIYRDGRAETIPLGLRANAIPTVVYVGPNGIVVGEPAEALGASDPASLIREFKRDIGTEGYHPGTTLTMEAITAGVLSAVLARVTDLQRDPPASVTITCPATWQGHRRDVLAVAAVAAGIESPALLTEPEAAAIYYAAEQRLTAGDYVGVFDFGGGTFDATVLHKTAGGFEIAGEPLGDDHLGGIDIDRIVMAHVADMLGSSWSTLDDSDPDVRQARQNVRRNAIEAKELLCSELGVSINVVLPGMITSVRLTRSELERLIRPLVDRALEWFEEALERADVRPGDLRAALLVGGSSRIPLVAELITGQLGVPVATDTHPKFAVCLGAAIAAGRRMLGVTDVPFLSVEPSVPRSPTPEATRPSTVPELGAEAVGRTIEPAPSTAESVDIPLDDEAVALDVDLAAQGLTAFLDVPMGPAVAMWRPVPDVGGPGTVLVRSSGSTDGSRRRGVLVGGAVAAVVIVAGVGLALTRGSGEEDGAGPTVPSVVVPAVTTVEREFDGVRMALVTGGTESEPASRQAFSNAISDARDADPRPADVGVFATLGEVTDTADAVIIGPGTVLSAAEIDRLQKAGVTACVATTPVEFEPKSNWLDLGVDDAARETAANELNDQGLVVVPDMPADGQLGDDEVVLVAGGDDDVVDFLVDTFGAVTGDAARVYDCAATVIAAWWSAAGEADRVDLSEPGTPCTSLLDCHRDPGSHWTGRDAQLIGIGAGDRRWRCDATGCEEIG